VVFSTSNGTAIGGAACGTGVDFVNTTQTVNFAPNETSKVVNVTLCGDLLKDSGETVNLTLSNGPIGFPSTAVLNINDTANQFTNFGAICTTSGIIPAAPYPATITVSGAATTIGAMRVTLYDVMENIPDNLDVLLVGPQGQAFILMADGGGNLTMATPVTLTFYDGSGQVLPNSGTLTTGSYEPTSWESGQTSFPAPAPPAPYNEPGSAVGGTTAQTLNGIFGGTNANGVWSLYVRDDGGASATAAVSGCIGGWGLEFLSSTAQQASISGRVLTAQGQGIRNAQVVVTGNSLSAPRVTASGSMGYFTIDGLDTGETYVVTVNSKRYTFSAPSLVVSLVDNVVDLDFIADPQE